MSTSKGKQATFTISSDEEDTKPAKNSKPKAAPPKAGTKRKVVESSSEEEDEPKKPAKKAKVTKSPAKPKTTAVDKKTNGDAKPKFVPNPNRGKALAEGSKEVPIGEPNCLAGLTLVFTGNLLSLDRDTAQGLAKRYGAKVTGAPSSKTTYVVLGADAGPKKLETIAKYKIPTLDEDGFLNLIGTRGAGEIDEKTVKKQKEEEKKIKAAAKDMGPATGSDESLSQLWTVKYAPKVQTDICGNKGQVEKLRDWLHNWPKYLKSNFKKPGPNGLGAFRAVIISGPPGIGKTTAATVIAKLEGFTVLEMNASDVRAKKALEAAYRATIQNTSIDNFFEVKGSTKDDKATIATNKTVLIMDEVDGMSGGDRGGVGAINMLIKKTKIPIICIANDNKSQKMKPFQSTCFALPFKRPSVQEVKSRLMTICFKEKIKLENGVLDSFIEGTNSDIRQVINLISTAKLSADKVDFDKGKQMVSLAQKNTIQTPFTLINTLMGPQLFASNSRATLNDKLDFFFHDFSLMPLFVQENYLKNKFYRANNYQGKELEIKRIELACKAAESISDGDLVDGLVHGSTPQWSLLPVVGMFSTVRPAYFCHGMGSWKGEMGSSQQFPAWLGKNSSQNKMKRLLGEVQIRMRLKVSGDRNEIRNSYIPTLLPKMTLPLINQAEEGVEPVIDIMDEYFLTKDEWDGIVELGLGENDGEQLLKKIPTKVKTAFTRNFNKRSHPIPFHKATDTAKAFTKGKANEAEPDLEDIIEAESDAAPEEEVVDDESEEGDVAKDKLIKSKTKPKKSATGTAKAASSKAKAPAKPKATAKPKAAKK